MNGSMLSGPRRMDRMQVGRNALGPTSVDLDRESFKLSSAANTSCYLVETIRKNASLEWLDKMKSVVNH